MQLNLEDLISLEEDIKSFYAVKKIKRLHKPSNEEFLREAVSAHQPCIITGLIDDWPALKKWKTNDGFLADAPAEVPVNLTPNGKADSVIEVENGQEYFVTPAEIMMSTKMFLNMLDCPNERDPIPYLSSQNDNIREKMPTLLESINQGLSLAECFKTADGCSLEAINLWFGDERSVSSTHKDFFENFYCVVRGEKEFMLFPPTDVIHLKSRTYPRASYNYHASADVYPRREYLTMDFEPEADKVQWIKTDPTNAHEHSMGKTNPITVRVLAGEVLYLPAMWLHRVTQTRVTISVNYWYDMRFDHRYVLLSLASKLKSTKEGRERLKEKKEKVEK